MHEFVGEVNEVYPAMLQAVFKFGERVPSRVAPTIELHPLVAEFENPRRRLVTSYGRAVNVPFMLAEVVHILNGREDLAFLDQFNSQVKEYSDDGVRFNAAYGHRLRHAHGYDQVRDVIKLLKRDRGTRQATLTIWHPDDRHHELVHVESHNGGVGDGWSKEEPRQVKDRACNLLAHLMIRDGVLNWMQVMRSNDAIWGLPYNLMQWTYLMEYIANEVGVELGVYRHIADSFHIYDYHEDEASKVAPFDLYEHQGLRSRSHAPMIADESALEAAVELANHGWSSVHHPGNVPQWVIDFGQIWSSWRSYKELDDAGAQHQLTRANDQIFAAATYRFYWSNRWHKQDPGHPRPDTVRAAWGSTIGDWIMAS
jgi:thymidylate synthase